VRFYLIDAIPTGRDGEFTLEQFVEHVNTHLANKLGNLASRTITLVHKYFQGKAPVEWAPDAFADPAAREALDALLKAAATTAVEAPKAYEALRLNEALEHVWNVVERANEFTDRAKPWESGKDPARRAELGTTLSALLETLRLVAIWAWPVIPQKSERLWTLLGFTGTPQEARGDAPQPRFGPAEPRALGAAEILFPRIDLEAASAKA
jgi:methionyl-tRNA synthetase